MRLLSMLAAAPVVMVAAPAVAQDWRDVPAENLLIIDTTKGRVMIELLPDLAPNHVERIKVLTLQRFYDGLKFHRVIDGFMAQTGDPLGTGAGGSDLPDLTDEFGFRRARSPLFMAAPNAGEGTYGFYAGVPIQTQPDAQMMVTADGRVPAVPLFCPGVVGMAKSTAPNTANSQFFIMTGVYAPMNGQYTAFGHVVSGQDTIEALNDGPREQDGKVANPDVMTRVRVAADLPDAERPSVRVAASGSAAYQAALDAARDSGGRLDLCGVTPPVDASE